MPNRIIIALLSSLLIALAVIASIIFNILYSPIDSLSANHSDSIIFDIAEGSSLSRVASQLNEQGYLPNQTLFKLLARVRGVENSIRTGEYQLNSGMSPAELLRKIVSGDTVQYRVTFVEGWSFRQALNVLWGNDNILNTLESLSPIQISNRLGLASANPEGLLYPDTYFYTKGITDLEILSRASNKLEFVLAEAWEFRAVGLPYETPYDALKLASIIEKESASNSERNLIAAVFVTRMNRGMRLQSDPTVIYGMGERYDGNIRREDLLEETPYNTYRIEGLPPTPIALSGKESILAALAPSDSDYLYFVAKGDGSHEFSRTLQEHNAAVQLYQSGVSSQ